MKGKRYSKVSRRMWNDAGFRALSAPPPNARTLWFRLLTGPELTNIPGLFEASEGGLADALGWPIEAFREAFREVSAKDMAKADWEARLVWVPRAIRHNPPESPNVVKAWEPTWDLLPECPLKSEAWRALRDWCKARGKSYPEAFAKACPKPSGKAWAIQEQEQEQEQEPTTRAPAREQQHPAPTEPQAEWAKVLRAFEEGWHGVTGQWLGLNGGGNNQRRGMAVAAKAHELFGDRWLAAVSAAAQAGAENLRNAKVRSVFATWAAEWASYLPAQQSPADQLLAAIDDANQRGEWDRAEKLEAELRSLREAS